MLETKVSAFRSYILSCFFQTTASSPRSDRAAAGTRWISACVTVTAFFNSVWISRLQEAGVSEWQNQNHVF